MVEVIVWFILTRLLLTPLLGYGTAEVLLKFSDSAGVLNQPVKKWRVSLFFMVFYCSIFIFYKNDVVLSPLFELVYRAVSSPILGALWMWLVLGIIDGLGVRKVNVSKWSLWALCSLIAFAIFVLSK